MALSAVLAGLAGSAIGNVIGANVSARNTDVNQQTAMQTSPITETYGDTYSSGYSNSVSSSSSLSDAWAEGWTAGREASQADIQRAAEANQAQKEMMQMQMDYNTAEAKLAREWSEKMSNTAYQRAVKDLKKAGLSPILAAGNLGASTPSASYASSALGTANKANSYAEQYSHSGSHSESQSSSSSHSSESSSGHTRSETKPAYIKAEGSAAEALANNLNVSSAQALENAAILAGMGVG